MPRVKLLTVREDVAPEHDALFDELAALLERFPLALTVEAHYRVGGLGSLVAEVLAERRLRCQLVCCGVPSTPDGVTGHRAYLNQRYGLSAEKIVGTVMETLGRAKA